MPASPAPDALLLRVRALAAACLLGLIVNGLAWELWLAPTGGRTWALKVLPLAVAIFGVLKFRMTTHRWLSLLVWLYVAEALVRATTERGLQVSEGLPAQPAGLHGGDVCADIVGCGARVHLDGGPAGRPRSGA